MLRKFWHALFFYCILSLAIPRAFGQPDPTINAKVTISSPTAASLGKFGDIPVNTHTGIPEINIPLYQVHTGTLDLPISLSYHASGTKVEEQASWVGAGWALNAGGVITRTVMGAPDDRGINASYTTHGYFSDYGIESYLFSIGPIGCDPPGGPGPSYCPVGRSGVPGSVHAPQDGNVQSGIFDGEPDLYTFNFNGYTGKFYFNDDRSVITMPDQDIKITPVYPYTQSQTNINGIAGFVITTKDGTQYTFGKNPNADGNIDAIEQTYNVSTQNTWTAQGANSSWYLNKISSADGQFTITLIYQAEAYSCYSLAMHPIPSVTNPNIMAYNLSYDLNKDIFNGVRLSKIVYANGEVDFNAGNLRQDLGGGSSLGTGVNEVPNSDATHGARALGNITIQGTGICKKYTFNTSYWYDNTPLTGNLFTQSYAGIASAIVEDEYRLRLDSLGETSCDGTASVPAYTFSYYSGVVPRKLSFGIDHWGFSNGVTNNNDLIPTYTTYPASIYPGPATTVPGADRDTHWPACEAGTLSHIGYPTGGSTDFTYESNMAYTDVHSYTKSGSIMTFSVGYDGSTIKNQVPFTTDGTNNTYELDISSNQPASEGSDNLEGATGSNFGNYSVTAGGSSTYYFTLSPNTTYNTTFYNADLGNGPTTGVGATAYLYEYMPTETKANVPVGGLRIKTIVSNDGLGGNPLVTNYGYNYDNNPTGISSGNLYSIPVYLQVLRNDAWGLVNGTTCNQLGCFTCLSGPAAWYQSPSSIMPMVTSQGNHIGYGQVYITNPNNGSEEDVYYSTGGNITGPFTPALPDVCVRSTNSFCDPDLPNVPAPPLPFDPMRGELAAKYFYDNQGNLLKQSNYYPLYQQDSLTTPGLISKFYATGYVPPPVVVDPDHATDPSLFPTSTFVPVGVLTFTEYNLQSSKKVRDSVVTTTYDITSGQSITDIQSTDYNSRWHNSPTRTISYSSKGETLVKYITSAFDFRVPTYTVPDQLNAYYGNITNDNTYLANAYANQTITSADPNYIWQRSNWYMNFRYLKAYDRQTYLNWRLQNLTGSGNTYATDQATAETTADGTLLPVYRLQDESINAPIEMSDWRNAQFLHAGFTEFDSSTTPTGFVYPGKSWRVDLQSPGTSFTNATISGNSLVKDGRYLPEDSYSFANGNLVTTTPHNGVTSSYLWDYTNTKPIAQATNATPDQIAYTSFEADGSGNWTIGTGNLDTSRSITGRNSYNLSNSTISKTGLNSSTTYIVSYWSQNGAYSIGGTISGYPITGKTVSYHTPGWTLYVHKVTGQSAITLTGTGRIDELRLYPSTAQMTTYTYDPLVGMTSQTDAGNRVTYYEYDGLQRLKRIRDQDYNILKSLEYQYQASTGCGGNCFSIPMQTLAGTATLSYPVGVFNIHGNLLGNATTPVAYTNLWNSDTADTRLGSLVVGTDSMHFKITLNTGQILPASVTGCRYYQVDLPWNVLDGVRNINAAYVDFGDGTSMRLGRSPLDITNITLAPNTVLNYNTGTAISDANFYIQYGPYYVHTYPDTSRKTITFYHNDSTETPAFDAWNYSTGSLSRITNFQGNVPQHMTFLGGTSYQQSGASSVANIRNWNTIRSITTWYPYGGYYAQFLDPWRHMGYAQDFMAADTNLAVIRTANGSYYTQGFSDTTFKLSRMKSNWTTYFTKLNALAICEDQWSHEDLSVLPNLVYFNLIASNLNHSNSSSGNAVVYISPSEIDTIFNQIDAGSGQHISGGTIIIQSGSTWHTSASAAAVAHLLSRGWTLTINSTTVTN